MKYIIFLIFPLLLYPYSYKNLRSSDFFVVLKAGVSEKDELIKEIGELKTLPPVYEIKKLKKNVFIIKFKERLNENQYAFLEREYKTIPFYNTDENSWPLVLSDSVNLKFKRKIEIKNFLSSLNIKVLSFHNFFDDKKTYNIKVENKNIPKLIETLKKTEKLEYIEPDFYIYLKKKFIPDDTYYPKQWHHSDEIGGIHSQEAWDITKGNTDISIALMDDGIDLNHEDLKITAYKDFTGKGFDDSGEHGTACAGLINAVGNNGKGVVGVCPYCSLVVAKIIPLSGYNTQSNIIEAFEWAMTKNVFVFSNSWGFNANLDIKKYYPLFVDLLSRINTRYRNGKGGVVVFASGNEGVELKDKALEMLDTVISTGALNFLGNRTGYSNYGEGLDFMAPSSTGYLGDDKDGVWTTDITGSKGINIDGKGYQETQNGLELLGDDVDKEGNYTKYFGGTSASAPILSGIIGLMFSLNRDLTVKQIYEILKLNTDKMNGTYDENGFSKYMGYGKVNAYKSLNYLTKNVAYCDFDCSGHGVCLKIENKEICNCENGYLSQGNECVEKKVDVCENINCSGLGVCRERDKKPYCECDDGYKTYKDIQCIAVDIKDDKKNEGCNFSSESDFWALILFLSFFMFSFYFKKLSFKK